MNYEPYRERLKADLTKITNDLKAIAIYHPQTDDWEAIPDPSQIGEADENNEADAVEEWNERRSTVSALEIEYRDLKRALNKLDTGTFGTCEISGEVIEAERLQAKPTARTCLKHRNEEATLAI